MLTRGRLKGSQGMLQQMMTRQVRATAEHLMYVSHPYSAAPSRATVAGPACLYGELLGWQTEGVEADGVQHVVALMPLKPRDDVCASAPHVNSSVIHSCS